MTLPFQEKVVNESEYSKYNFEHPNFIGYLNPHGEVLDYCNPLGLGGHNCDRTTVFLNVIFVCQRTICLYNNYKAKML